MSGYMIMTVMMMNRIEYKIIIIHLMRIMIDENDHSLSDNEKHINSHIFSLYIIETTTVRKKILPQFI